MSKYAVFEEDSYNASGVFAQVDSIAEGESI